MTQPLKPPAPARRTPARTASPRPVQARHYAGLDSPLGGILGFYANFFGLFGDFHGYVEHFLLHDLVDGDVTTVRYFQGVGDFSADPLPVADVTKCREDMTRSMAFIRAHKRIAAYAAALLA